MAGEEIKGHLDALLLAVVSEGRVHGYAVVERLRERSGGRFDLPEGTVYPALHRLEADGLLQSSWTVVAGRRRRQYELTDRGRAELGERWVQWRRFAAAVEHVLGGPAAIGPAGAGLVVSGPAVSGPAVSGPAATGPVPIGGTPA